MLKKIHAYTSDMRTDRLPETHKLGQHGDLCDGTETHFAMVSVTGTVVTNISIGMSRSVGNGCDFKYCSLLLLLLTCVVLCIM
jgi:hypothetical protein